jgi:uncharacterized SAM-binding protein YcdF (DUF218 family)
VFYLLSKILDVILTPLAWGLTLLALGTLGRGPSWRRRGLTLLGFAVLLVFSLEPVSNALFASLEDPPLRTFRPDVTYDVVILLGGVVEDRVQATWGQRAFNDDNERLLETYDLLRTGSARYAIASGGAVSPSRAAVVEGRALKDQLVAWGIASERVIAEEDSRNTYENAVDSAAIVRAHDWKSVLLVTSAFHMPRAYGCFRAVLLDVDTLPVDFRSYKSPFTGELVPRADHLARSTTALREWFGRGVYRLRGYSR